MKHRFDYQHIALALLATLILAGLFYLPYLAVRNKTVDTFRIQQSLLAQQAGAGLQDYFSAYDKALAYLVRQPAIQRLDESGKVLLRDFFSIHPEDILAIRRLDDTGAPLFATPSKGTNDQAGAAAHCLHIRDHQTAVVSDLIDLSEGGSQVYFAAPVLQDERFAGCLSFTLPFARVAGRYLDQIPLHRHGYALVFSQGGKILAAPDATLVGKDRHHLRGEADELAQLGEAIAGGEPAIVTLSRDLRPDADPKEERMYAVVYPVELPGDTRWSMVLLTPAKEVLGAMAEFRSQWLMVTAVAVIAVGLLSLLLSTIVTRRREEQRQRAVEEQLAGLLDLAPMGVFLLDARHAVLYANREATRMVGGDGEQVIGRSFIDFLHRDCRSQVAERIGEPSAGEAIRVDVAQLLGFSGIKRDIVITVTPYRLGSQPQSILIVRDVTKERRSAALQRRLTEAVDQVKEAVLIANSDGSIDYVNAALGEMTGYSREECYGQPVRMLWAKEQDAHFDQKIEDVVELGEVWRGRIVNQRKDGSLFVAAATVSPMRDAGGSVAHFVLVQRDITHEVEIESRMRQAQKMEAIGTLAGGIAHDFNNILGGIIGFTDMALLLSTPGTEVHNNLLHIRQGGRRAADLVQQILTFSRQSVMEKIPVPVAPLIKESLKLMRATLPTTIDIHQDLLAADAVVMAAPVQIQQIVMNLCANAFYAMREKGGLLTIRLERRHRAELGWTDEHRGGDDWIVLVVEDTGQGIDSDLLQRIFTPFFTTKQPGEGTGMGLSVVHGIVRDLGGEISVQSQPGQGTVFTVLLPEADREKNGSLTSSEEPLPAGSEHILVVDDEKEIRETCRMMLSHLGYTVTTTGNPQEVLTLIEQAEPPVDLVLTDQTMPKMTGIDLTGEIRRLRPDIPVILCTGYSDRLNYDIARRAGACDLLMKPMDLRGLSTAVRSALDMSR